MRYLKEFRKQGEFLCDVMQHVSDGLARDIDVYLSAEERFITILHLSGENKVERKCPLASHSK